ncbi:protein PIF-like [Mytilus californianus]|uniref:protein PIF-like n=1 Tax=Mytilus californianus TaxID=6549 RepID=UPI002246A7E9|nr:protein PIF-like [Mytilus californianus]
MENGAGYNSHPTDCDKYTQCLFDKEGLLTAFYRNCPWGQHWNQDILSCQPPKHAMCKNDPCLNVRFETYAAKSSCRAYWECQGYSVPMCCPQGHAYLSNVGCVRDYSCQDECQSDNVPKYSACKSLMFLEFTKHISDSSGNDVFVKNENVKVTDGVAYFNGSARLVIPQFTNAELGNNFGFRIRFKETKIYPGHGLRQSIINNGDCGDLGSVRLTINDNNVEFGLKTDGEEGPKELRIKKPSVEWTEVVYYVTDNKLNGWVNGEASSVIASGQIEKRKCALQIGHGEGFSNFVGFIDEFYIEMNSSFAREKEEFAIRK